MPVRLALMAVAAVGSYFAGKKAEDISDRASSEARSATYKLNSAKERLEEHIEKFNDEIRMIHEKHASNYCEALNRSNIILSRYNKESALLSQLDPPVGFESAMLIKSAKDIVDTHRPKHFSEGGKKLVEKNIKSAYLATRGSANPALTFALAGFASISEAHSLLTQAESYKADVDKYLCEIDETIKSIDASSKYIDLNAKKIEMSLDFFKKYIVDAENIEGIYFSDLTKKEKDTIGYLYHIQMTMDEAANCLSITGSS